MDPPSSKEPVFVVGALRSGTTLLRLMLSFHPSISGVHEFEYALSQAGDRGWPELAEYRAFLRRDRVFSAHPLVVDESLSYPDLVRDFHRQRHAERPEAIPIDVIHSAFHRCPDIWPHAKYVHVLRDPRDVSRSCVGMGWHGNVYGGTKVWLLAERRWDALCRRTQPAQRYEVRYEELVREPRAELERLCGFLGIPYDPAMLTYAEGTTYEAPDPRLAEQWRRKMSSREVQLVEAACADMLVRRGYSPSGFASYQPGRVERAWLEVDSRVRRLRKAVQRYGIGLALQQRVARFAPEPFRVATQRRINAIDTTYLK